MKIERTRDLQGQRTDREKSNKIAIVKAFPNKGFEGDEIYMGAPPEQVNRGEGFYKRLNGKWIFIGRFAEVAPEAEDTIAEITFSSELGVPIGT